MPRFSLRQILIGVAAVGFGLAIFRLPKGSWIDIPLSALSCCFVLSLCRHAWDTSRILKANPDLPLEQRWGGRLRVVVLLGTATGLIVAWMLSCLAAAELVLTQPRDNYLMVVDLPALPRDLAVLAMLAAIGLGSCQRSPSKPTPTRQKIYQAVAAGGALIGILAFWADRMLIWFLVHLAILGVEVAQPSGAWPPEINVSTAVRAHRFMLGSFAGLAFVVANLLLIAGLVKWWGRPRCRWLLAVSLAGGLAGECSLATWISFQGLRQLSPTYWVTIQLPLAAILVAVSMVVLAATVFAWRVLAKPPTKDLASQVPTRSVFFHESWLGSLLLGMVATASVVDARIHIAAAPQNAFSFLRQFFSWTTVDWQMIYYDLTTRPAMFIAIAAASGGFTLAWLQWRRRKEPVGEILPSVNPAQFAVTMVSLLIMVLAAAPIIAAASFSYWLLRAAMDI